MKNLKSKLRLSLCLLILCFSTFAQTDEIIVTRADLEKCATYKRQNELLERQTKFQAIENIGLNDTLKARNKSIKTLKADLLSETEAKEANKTWALYATIAFLLSILILVFRSKIAKLLPFVLLISIYSVAQDPVYRPPLSINGQKGLNQKIVFDTTSSSFSVVSVRDTHKISIPVSKIAQVAKFNNITIIDSATFTHSLSSTKLAVMFFENQTKEVSFIDWFPDTTNTIKVYLPYRDKPTKYKFVGDVYVIKRY